MLVARKEAEGMEGGGSGTHSNQCNRTAKSPAGMLETLGDAGAHLALLASPVHLRITTTGPKVTKLQGTTGLQGTARRAGNHGTAGLQVKALS